MDARWSMEINEIKTFLNRLIRRSSVSRFGAFSLKDVPLGDEVKEGRISPSLQKAPSPEPELENKRSPSGPGSDRFPSPPLSVEHSPKAPSEQVDMKRSGEPPYDKIEQLYAKQFEDLEVMRDFAIALGNQLNAPQLDFLIHRWIWLERQHTPHAVMCHPTLGSYILAFRLIYIQNGHQRRSQLENYIGVDVEDSIVSGLQEAMKDIVSALQYYAVPETPIHPEINQHLEMLEELKKFCGPPAPSDPVEQALITMISHLIYYQSRTEPQEFQKLMDFVYEDTKKLLAIPDGPEKRQAAAEYLKKAKKNLDHRSPAMRILANCMMLLGGTILVGIGVALIVVSQSSLTLPAAYLVYAGASMIGSVGLFSAGYKLSKIAKERDNKLSTQVYRNVENFTHAFVRRGGG